MTELIFNGIFSELNPAQCVALLSCFMCDEKSNTQIQMTDELSGSLRRMQVSGLFSLVIVSFFFTRSAHCPAAISPIRLDLNLFDCLGIGPNDRQG